MCGHYADLSGDGDIILVDQTFRGKPQTGITIACWMNLQGNVNEKHSLFSTVRMITPVTFIGMKFHLYLYLCYYLDGYYHYICDVIFLRMTQWLGYRAIAFSLEN